MFSGIPLICRPSFSLPLSPRRHKLANCFAPRANMLREAPILCSRHATIPAYPCMDTNRFLALYNFCLTFAKQQLEANGGFYPFGAVIDIEGRIEAAASGPHENPTTQEQMFAVLDNLFSVRAANREIQAAAIATWQTPTPRITPSKSRSKPTPRRPLRLAYHLSAAMKERFWKNQFRSLGKRDGFCLLSELISTAQPTITAQLPHTSTHASTP